MAWHGIDRSRVCEPEMVRGCGDENETEDTYQVNFQVGKSCLVDVSNLQ
jgi:hypothetical protein